MDNRVANTVDMGVQGSFGKHSRQAPLVTVVSASGGVGKSAISIMAGFMAARAGLDTVVLEADMQFGDLGFWFGLDERESTLALGSRAEPVQLAPGLRLYKAPVLPELAEEVSDDVARFVPQVRSSCDLVIADTGAFWSGLTADLVLSASAYLLVMDQRPSSVAGAVRAAELCRRIGVADVRRVCVCNRWSSKARLNEEDVRGALGTQELHLVAEGKQVVDELLCAGDAVELAEMENPFACGVDDLLGTVLPRIGCAYEPRAKKPRMGWFR